MRDSGKTGIKVMIVMVVRKRLNCQAGSTLAYVMMVMMVVFILVTAVTSMAMANIRQASSQEQGMQAYYVARSGAELAYDALLQSTPSLLTNSTNSFKANNNMTLVENDIDFEVGTADIKVFVTDATKTAADKIIRIESVGTLKEGGLSRKVTLDFYLEYGKYPDMIWSNQVRLLWSNLTKMHISSEMNAYRNGLMEGDKMKLPAKNNLTRCGGFTLVELMVTIVLIGMVIGLAGTFFNLSFLSERKVEDEYDLQASVRQASELLNNTIRKATVTFTLVNTEFEGAKKSKWNYFGVEDDTEIVQYTYNAATGEHDRKVLIKARDGISYNLYFKQNVPNSKLIQFNLECIPNGDVAKKIVVETELNAMNSVAVDDGGSPSNPATAIAYRSDPAPRPEVVTTNEEVTIAIALVLDKSGSMGYNMNGGSANGGNPSRGSIMKAQAVNLINNQFSTQNIWASVIPFSDSANNPLEMKDCRNSTQVSQLLNKVNSIVISVDDGGGTNTGDGLRRAYYQLKTYNSANPGKEIINYIILLTDGNPTFRSGTERSWWGVVSGTLTADGNCSYIWGTGQETTSNINTCMDYVDTIGSMIKTNASFPIRTFIIGFSGRSADVSRARDITALCTGSGDKRKGTYYPAESEIELEETLRSITTTILAETWHIYGPR